MKTIDKFRISLAIVFLISVTLNVAAFGAHSSSKLTWISDFQSGLRQAQQDSKLVFVDLSADWCPYCRQLDKNVLHDSQVIDFLSQYVTVRLDYDSAFGQSLKRRYDIKGVPCIMLFDSNGQLRDKLDGAPSSSADFIRYVTNFSKSDGSKYAQANSANQQAPATAQPAWLQPQGSQSNTWSNQSAVPFPSARSYSPAPSQPVQPNQPAWSQPQQSNWLGQPQNTTPNQNFNQQYQGNQQPVQNPGQQYVGNQPPMQYQQYPGSSPPQYSSQQYPGNQAPGQSRFAQPPVYPGQPYPGTQMPPQYAMPPQYPMQQGQTNQTPWPSQAPGYPQSPQAPTGQQPVWQQQR